MPDTNLPETEYLEVNRMAYQQLTHQAIDEVIRCLLVTESPSDLTVDKVRNRVRIFAACSTEPWVRATGAIQHKSGARYASSSALHTEYYRIIRTLRDHLIGTLLSEERAVWEEARKRMVNQAEYAIFRVTKSTIHLHRLTHNRQCRSYE